MSKLLINEDVWSQSTAETSDGGELLRDAENYMSSINLIVYLP